RAVKAHRNAKVVVVGCYAVSDRAEVEAIEGVDLVLGNNEKERLAEVLGNRIAIAPLLQIAPFRRPEPTLGRVRANLKVQTGCDEWCTFCIIPKTRGELRSMDEDRLIEEATARVASGARELVLTGVHLGKYDFDRGGDEHSLVRLLRRLLEIEGVWRLRLSSILCRHLTPAVVSFMQEEPRVCRYLHVPLQSGDDGILAAMHRPYNAAEYIDTIDRVKEAVPDVALATDIIVGFPGETEAAFAATEAMVDRIGFSKLHVFRYSARAGTAAAGMTDEVHPDVKRDRSKRLIARGAALRDRFLRNHLGRPLQVLVEDERVVDGESICSGQTDDYVRVWFSGKALLGRMVDVIADEIRADGLKGRVA
ncbi:MAG TPA: MiaB/RimO family radical SAM methylthiotransferase, partial [Actinomycetota bacterium]|nr:MiaB/RimO family radical SAM methylthiotransferase [Actinomycetota bacterium]